MTSAPVAIAKGVDDLAQRIKEMARESSVMLVEKISRTIPTQTAPGRKDYEDVLVLKGDDATQLPGEWIAEPISMR